VTNEAKHLDAAEIERTRHLLEGDATDFPLIGTRDPVKAQEEQVRRGRIWLATVDEQKKIAARVYREAIVKLYRVLGFDEGNCRSCGRRIWWVITKNKKPAPYTADGISHFADCPGAENHRGR